MNNIITGGFTSTLQAADKFGKNRSAEASNQNIGMSFQDILAKQKSIAEIVDETAQSGVKFSKHADMRLKQRDITLTDEQLSRLNVEKKKAGLKGIKESLVIMDDLAFIVNTQNNTVVTAMDKNNNEENIFTNIDGAVII